MIRTNQTRSLARALALLATLALVACCLLPAAAGAARKPHAKGRPIYWGAWIGSQLTGTSPPWDMSGVTAFEGIVGKGLSLVGFSSSFANCEVSPCTFNRFPTPAMENVRRYGAIPILSWGSESSPWLPGTTSQPDFQLADVISGRYDGYIAKFAEEARAWGHPFFLRFNWEMNGNWFPWSETVNENSPGEFIAAWRHVHEVFAAVGATNATWVWCPYADSNKKRFSNIRPLYPGDSYVDWTCMDGYNWGKTPVNPHPWKTFSQIFEPTYKLLTKKVAPKKPILLGEMASSPYGGGKAAWVREMLKKLPTAYPKVRGMVYFDSVDRGIDWPIETSPAVSRAFASGIRKGIFKGNRYAELSTSPIQPPR
jgi:hypothetical protein